MKTLTIYYSRSGNTKKLAEAVSKAVGGDLEEITEPHGRGGPLGWLRSGREASGDMMSVINPPKNDPASYDLVIVGTPIWAGKMSSPVRAYLTKVAGKIKRIAFFATILAGSDDSATYTGMEKITGHPEATLSIPVNELKGLAYLDKVNKFVETLQEHE